MAEFSVTTSDDSDAEEVGNGCLLDIGSASDNSNPSCFQTLVKTLLRIMRFLKSSNLREIQMGVTFTRWDFQKKSPKIRS